VRLQFGHSTMIYQVQRTPDSSRPRLSICIATYNRAANIAETLEAILRGLPESVEVVIVDGASPDNTAQIVEPFVHGNDAVRYFRETSNSGVDQDFDKAVVYARGEFCWLLSDDDILVPGAVARVLEALEPALDLLVVNSQMRNADLSVELSPRLMAIMSDKYFDAKSTDSFLGEVGDYLSFIGGVVIRRSRWLEREREAYFGSLFVHVGIIFQAPLALVKILADPLIVIRYGNAMWTNRGFEIWMFKWPNLIWSLKGPSDAAKLRVVAREPWRQWRRLTLYRSIGAYSYAEYKRFFANEKRGGLLQKLVSVVPAVAANGLTALYWNFANRKARAGIYDLARSRHSCHLTRFIARRLGIPAR
jgi:glycosyltransferase involved in cell wall biosynthesis